MRKSLGGIFGMHRTHVANVHDGHDAQGNNLNIQSVVEFVSTKRQTLQFAYFIFCFLFLFFSRLVLGNDILSHWWLGLDAFFVKMAILSLLFLCPLFDISNVESGWC